MKKILLLLVSCSTLYSIKAQNKEIKFEGLNAPSSPAFNLLGISPSTIDKPVDITSFAVSIQNASNDFNSVPKNYAMEFLPFTLFSINSMTTTELNNTKFKDVFKQTLLISLGVSNETENEEDATIPKLTKLGIGLKFSIIRPGFDKSTIDALKTLYKTQENHNIYTQKTEAEDEMLIEYNNLKKEVSKLKIPEEEKAVKLREIIILEQKRKMELPKEKIAVREKMETELSGNAKAISFKRSGVFLDFACGTVIDFKEETFNRSQLSKAGAWLTGGYRFKNSLDILGIARYLYQPDKLLADDSGLLDTKNVSSLDGGLRLVYKTLKREQLSLSAESVYRSVLESDSLKPSWRLVCNASYDFGNSKVVTFSFGKDFDNSFIKGKNLIAALNFIIGLGNQINNDTHE